MTFEYPASFWRCHQLLKLFSNSFCILKGVKHILYCVGLSCHLPVQTWPFSLQFIQLKYPHFSVSFFFPLLTTSPWWASDSMLPVTDLLFIPANWTSFDGPNFDYSAMLPSDFNLLISSSILSFDVSGTSNWFDSSFPSASFDAITSMCLPSNPSQMDIFRTNSMRFSTVYYFVTAC